ncbi:hypothetical protein DCE93_08480 [Agromyces badenianii]|uniref:DUF2157 domain-containing protein n=1 Tax=Agromyces badenianii TaxID=2080742 RepID=A0A2S0WWH5_9MICO|nr:hypothetical protein [Agromyces badenianii]AWB95696.1 hypothetical protein DCE93_08480 [Agromyces badenianii]
MPDHPHVDRPDLRRWPTSPAQLIDTTLCPACFSPLGSAVCGSCGLDLAVPAAGELLTAGRRVHDDEASRQSLISAMRSAQAARPRGTAEARVMDVAAEPAIPPLAAAPAVSAAVAAPPALPASSPAAVQSGRSGVQVLLLTLGVVLISITAIVFLFVAYLVASLEVRSVIIAVASVLVLGVAWLLRARRLPGTAEGVASVSIVLLLLDVWIVRANGLFGTDALSAAGYTGGALLIVAAALIGVRAASGIRVAGFAAAVLAPIGVFLLAGEAAPEEQLGTAWWLGFLAVALLGSVGALLPRSIERVIVMAAGFAAGALAMIPAGWALVDTPLGRLWAYLAVAASWVIALIVVRRRRHRLATVWGRIAAPALGLSLALAPTVSIFDELDTGLSLWLAPAAGGLVACVFAAGTRLTGGAARDALWACVAAAAVAAASAVPGALLGLGAIGFRLIASVPPWNAELGSRPEATVPDHELTAVLVPFVIAVGALGVSMLLRRTRTLAAIPVGATFASGLVAAAVAPNVALSAVALLVLGGGALAFGVSLRRLALPGVLTTLVVFGVGSAALAWLVGYSNTEVWPWVSVLVIGLAVAGRVLSPRVWQPTARPGIGAAHLAIASTLVCFAVFSIPLWLESGGSPLVGPWATTWMWLATVSAVVLAGAALVRSGSTRDRLAVVIPLFAASAISLWALAFEADAAFRWIPAVIFVVAGVLWVRFGGPELLRTAFAAATPLAIAFASATVVDLGFGPEFVGIGLAGAALLAAALAHVVTARPGPARPAWGAAVALVGVTALISAPTGVFGTADSWLVLLLLTPVPIVLAALDGDPIGGEQTSRHLGWLSLGLGIATVWAWLAGDGVDDVEAYTLPLAAVLASTGGLITWRRTSGGAPAGGRTALFGTAAAVAVLPSIGSAGESELRTLLLASIGVVVAIASIFLPDAARGVPVRLLGVVTGWVSITGAALVRGSAVASGSADSALIPEFWPLLALASGAVIAVMWARTASRPVWLADVLLAASVTLAVVPTLLAIFTGDDSAVRAAVLFPLLALAHIASAATATRPVGGAVFSWMTLGVLEFGGVIALSSAQVDPFDLVTVPAGIALIGNGWFRMRRSPALGSWPALGAGLAVLLIPPLVADFTDPELWRIVTLGIVAAVALVIGAVRRLQAPLLLGGGVLLVHAIVQLWPWITALYEAVWWWLWLGIAGVLLVVLAATYERQLRLARGTIRSISDLR